ncbi:MAG: nucleoside-diphosphate sugar epimerase [Flavobacteriaceae bacterium]|nr:nucleoside-diphosphate sugar epimerase [Flavobacteriaceae bacterium]|tara:strand:+ start:3108 stop:4133 length:1026 start_codon:yes stop_codon:yes gene_type:complete
MQSYKPKNLKKRKKILIIGGIGFIGHNLAIFLKKKNFLVYVLDSLSVNNLKNVNEKLPAERKLYKSILDSRIKLLKNNKIKMIIQDARNNKKIFQHINKINPDTVIHLAAVSHANKSNKDPHQTFDNSLRTLENTLDAIKDKKKHIIYLSSSMVYGNFDGREVKENEVCNPLGIYGNLKLAGEMIVKSYNQVFNIPYTIIRPSALYGERCVSRRVSQIFVENALRDKKIVINGDGEEKLDFTYILDLINGIYLCCIKSNAKNQIFNLTFGNAKKINDLIKLIKKNFKNIKVEYQKRDKLTPVRGTLSIKKAKRYLNYKPKYSIMNGYVRYINWYKYHFKNH